MPKVTLTQSQKDRERVKGNLLLLKGGRTNADMAKIIGSSAETFRGRLNDPGKLTVDELMRLCRRYHITASELLEQELVVHGK